ncbi:scavenger receptor cysteine-rich type 1 protein M130-like [Kryptolebias marmoratus]|uniref:scavenger receptor cysteine-rich type 1 protein M130-like n=1 Tax=Kryptolebias marmoratus TaxID=37003 RepID=UPI000D530BE1|nr:scavenger receptor cysteine-rich type 1 protein M130-like [Kryptolebias marmoratus]
MTRAAVAVFGFIRVAGPTECSGRVEVFSKGIWGTVCDEDWTVNDTTVVCRNLGCEFEDTPPTPAHFEPGAGQIWIGEVECSGSESQLTDCSHSGFGNNICDHSQDVGVICDGVEPAEEPFTVSVVRLKLVRSASLDLNDPGVLEDLLDQLTEQLKEQGVDRDVGLSWKQQSNGKIFLSDETD